MAFRNIRLMFLPLAGGLAVIATLACSSEEGNGEGGSGGMAGSMGGSPSGGADAGTNDSGNAGGGSGGASAESGADPFTCFARQVDPDPPGTAGEGADCCNGVGTCAADAPSEFASSLGRAGCSDGLLCLLEEPSAAGGFPNGELPRCTAAFGELALEGRCLPRCFTLGNPSAGSLDSGDCEPAYAEGIGLEPDDIVCAPCFNPIDGARTGACDTFGDTPTSPNPPPGFAECGSWMGGPMMGYCVPRELIANAGADLDLLPQDTCNQGELCAPKNKVEDTDHCFEKCDQPVLGDEGAACVPTYIVESTPDGMGLSPTLGQSSCSSGETCTPCIHFLTRKPTRACDN